MDIHAPDLVSKSIQMIAPEPQWPPVPKLGQIRYIRYGLHPLDHDPFSQVSGPREVLHSCATLLHPYARPPKLDPTLERTLAIAQLDPAEVARARMRRLKIWHDIFCQTADERIAWLNTLPSHAMQLYEKSGFNGPLFRIIHQYMLNLGYPDKHLFDHICKGFPSGCVLPRTGLWRAHPDFQELLKSRVPAEMARSADSPGAWRAAAR